MDLLGNNSLGLYRDNFIVNTVTMLLIILGGLGFPVWWDLVKNLKKKKKRRFLLHTKLVLTVTAILIFGGMLLILFIEYNNPDTLGSLSFPKKVQAAMFQSVTTRNSRILYDTAGEFY